MRKQIILNETILFIGPGVSLESHVWWFPTKGMLDQ